MLLKRQRPKDYGTKKFFEGHYSKGQSVLVVDDVLMTGGTLVDDIPVRIYDSRLSAIGNNVFRVVHPSKRRSISNTFGRATCVYVGF